MIVISFVDSTRLGGMDCFSDGGGADFPQIFGYFQRNSLHIGIQGLVVEDGGNVEEALISLDDTYFHRPAR
jgi:hypothetical protein